VRQTIHAADFARTKGLQGVDVADLAAEDDRQIGRVKVGDVVN
jgi:hypothetical protein